MYRSEENYLKLIYELTIEKDKKLVRLSQLASKLGYTDQSVNEKVKSLAEKDYVVFIPYKGIHLTTKGKKEAIRMVRAHRLWEVFLYEKFNYSWTDLHDDACELEHGSSSRVIENLYDFLGQPKYCSHGNPIPDLNGKFEKLASKPLIEMKVNEKFVLKRVIDQKDLLQLLDKLNIKLNSELIIKEINDFAGFILVEVDSNLKQITKPIAKMMFTFD